MNRIELTNFRVFKEATALDLAPITILTGKNNSGKSSLMKSFVLLSDYMEPDSNQLILDLNGKQAHKHKINKFYNVKHWESDSKEVHFRYDIDEYSYFLKFIGQNEETFARLSEFVVTNNAIKDNLLLRRNSEYIFELRVSQQFIEYMAARRSSDILLQTSSPNVALDQILIQLEMANSELNSVRQQLKQIDSKAELTYFIQRQQELENKLRLLNEQRIRYAYESDKVQGLVYNTQLSLEDEDFSTISLAGIIRRALMRYFDENKEGRFRARMDEDRSLYRFYDQFSRRMAVFVYHLSPNRTYQARLYTKQQTDNEINEILTHYALAKARPGDTNTTFINKWLQEFEIGEQINVELVEGVATKVTIRQNGRWVNLVNLGFGAGQVLTILLKIASVIAEQSQALPIRRPRSPIVLVEEPEANLHPRLQSKLADMFIDASKNFRLRFVLETHSEYLIRRLQLMVASDLCDTSDAIIYYLDQQDVKRLEILSDGGLSGRFGKGFLDEADEKAMELYRIQKRKELGRK
ncbi:hypothetical protein GCM10027341_27130 [Spirosoma knui]